MNLHAHTNPSRRPDEIEQPSPAPAEIDRTPARPDETDTQREYQDMPGDNDPVTTPPRHA